MVAKVSNRRAPERHRLELITRLARVKCSPDDTVGDLKLLVAAQIGSTKQKIVLKKGCVVALFGVASILMFLQGTRLSRTI